MMTNRFFTISLLVIGLILLCFQAVFYPNVSAPETIKPFDYITTYAPANSFGASDFTEQYVNWSWVNSHVTYSLKRGTTDVTNSLVVNFSTVFTYRKYSYSFTASASGYHLLTLTFDSKAVSSWIDNINHTAYFNYSDGQLFYNFTDIYDIQQIDKSFNLNNNVFIMTVGKNVNKNVRVVLDPTFGYTGILGTTRDINDDVLYFKPYAGHPSQNGYLESISVYLGGWAAGEKVNCSLYNSTSAWGAANLEFFGHYECVGSSAGGATGWYTFNFVTKPKIWITNEYALAVSSDSPVNCYISAAPSTYNNYYRSSDCGYSYWVDGFGSGQDFNVSIYATFESGGASAPNAPSGFAVQSVAGSTSNLTESWTKGSGADYTRIQYKTGSYPTSISDGTNTYNGTGTSDDTAGLNSGIKYYFRAWSWNTTNKLWSTANGSAYNTTYSVPLAPSSFDAVTYNCSQINITWTKGTNATYTRIQRRLGAYPTDIANGTNVYNNTGTSYNDGSLAENTKYFYRSWSWNSTSKLWSTANASDNDTTQFCPVAPSPPSLFVATNYSCSQINITWLKGLGADYTRIQRNTGAYPVSISDGTNVYNGTAELHNDATVSASTQYFYRAWSWNTTFKLWSTTNASDDDTTPACPLTRYCPTQSYNYTNYSIWWCADFSVPFGTMNYTVNTTLNQNYSGNGVANGTYCFLFKNLTLNTTYYVNVSLKGTNCWDNDTYTVNLSFGGSSTGCEIMGIVALDVNQLILLIIISCWLFFTKEFLKTKELSLAWVQFAFAMPLTFLIADLMVTIDFGYIIACIIPLLSIILLAIAYYRK